LAEPYGYAGANSHAGFLVSAIGCGALGGAITLASMQRLTRYGRIIICMALLFSLAIAGLSVVSNFHIALMVTAFLGCGLISQLIASNTAMQSIVDNAHRGRVMSLYTMSFTITGPLGSLAVGALASHFGAAHTLLVCALSSLVGTIIFTGKVWSITVTGRAEIRDLQE
jgi:MFS family permease